MMQSEQAPEDDDDATICCERMLEWFHTGHSSCRFARYFSRAPREITPGEFEATEIYPMALPGKLKDVDFNAVHLSIDEAGDEKQALLAIFPDLRTDEEIAGLIDALCAHERWTLQGEGLDGPQTRR